MINTGNGFDEIVSLYLVFRKKEAGTYNRIGKWYYLVKVR
jgi:hypothetical protein